MTASELYVFFKPYTRATCPARPHGFGSGPGGDFGGNSDGGPGGGLAGRAAAPGPALFVSAEGIRVWAEIQGLPRREAMARLLGHGIWPDRFRRNFGLISARGMARLLRSRALVLGCGGLGGHVAELLARTGVGFLRLVDNDVFEESNLNRQRFCTESALGRAKAQVTREALADAASHLEADVLVLEADENNLPELVHGMDAALDCLDTIAGKTALEKAALAARIPFVHGSVLREEGFAYVTSATARLPGLYPQGQSDDELARARREGIGTLAPAAVACLMARLCLRVLLASEDSALMPEKAASPLYHLDLSVPELERFAWPLEG